MSVIVEKRRLKSAKDMARERTKKRKKKGNKVTKEGSNAEKNKAGYTAQDAPSMRTYHLRKKHGTDGRTHGRTDTTSYRDATAHLKRRGEKKGNKK